MTGTRDSASATATQPPSRAVDSTDPHLTDPALLRDNSELKSYETSRFEYPDIRVFFRQHAKAKELPAPLPLVVCIPGLGGSVAQFHPLLSSLVDLAPCLAVDFPGGGRSSFSVTSWDAYTPTALGELLETIIEDYRDTEGGQPVVLIGHSMGTALSAWLANRHVSHATALADHVVGLVAICPTSGPWDESKSTMLRRLFWIPGWVFALWRAWDARGGPESASVSRFVGEGAEPELKMLQYRFNQQSRTPVFRRMAYGALPVYHGGKPDGGLPGLDVWAGLDIPIYLIAGEKDHLTPPTEVSKIAEAMGSAAEGVVADAGVEPDVQGPEAAAPVCLSMKPPDHVPNRHRPAANHQLPQENVDGNEHTGDDLHDDPSTPIDSDSSGDDAASIPLPPQPDHPKKVVQSIVIPAPANHALLYMPRSARALAGLISDFLATKVTGRLSLAWQLQYLSREGKWDVKNLNKWKSVTPVSHAIGPEDKPIFRAMKTLREADDVHCPKEFVDKWSSVVKDVIDISKDQPVYDPRGLERGGVHYSKFPTVSKIPPEGHEVEAFIRLVDRLRQSQKERAVAEAWEDPDKCVIGVHCHYGFNRTGYFIVCYLVERCGYSLPEAIEAFARARPNGIRHSHFLDRLFVRYNIDRA
ncbi:dual specificity phosphatase catalytic domain protein [Purpureocillium lavendulum]|uniref:Dual specificity phosphatase catalytic domain protein n=1 Tax=Purpureocillium lavendulum TaxID=1247861 RepID=A0AB34FNH6_9HYPO|nr:dual specificity phosphatase catalytic domain protein [Purpureocillium lavendulum]